MTEKLTVHEAITAVILELPAVGKDNQVDGKSGGYKYRGIEAIKAALKPLLAKHGVHYAPTAITQVDDSTYQVGSGSTWQRVRLLVTYRVYGPDGSFIEAVGRGESADNSDKACNKAMTVAEKQVLGQVFCIADADGDPDQTRAEEQSAPNLKVPQLKQALAAAIGKDAAALWWKDNEPGFTVSEWTPEQARKLVDEATEWAA